MTSGLVCCAMQQKGSAMTTENGQNKMPDQGQIPAPGNNPTRSDETWSGPDGERYGNNPDGFSRGNEGGHSWPSWDVGGGGSGFFL